MATNEQIFAVRLSVKDPIGYTFIVGVANAGALPSAPVAQALYYVTDVKEYQAFEDGEWKRQNVVLADTRISALYDMYENVDQVAAKLVNDLITHYGQLLALAYKSHDDGSESFDKQTLSDLVSFYKTMKKLFEDEVAASEGANTGLYAKTKRRCIGGML